MTSTKTKTILESCDIWDIDYNSDNWELEIMTIYVSWQLRVTLDSIRNSCDVFEQILQTETCWFFPHTDIDNSGRGCIDFVQRQNARKYPQNTLCLICRLESVIFGGRWKKMLQSIIEGIIESSAMLKVFVWGRKRSKTLKTTFCLEEC